MLLDQRIAYNVIESARNVPRLAGAQARSQNHLAPIQPTLFHRASSVAYLSHSVSSFSQGTQSSVSQVDSHLADRFFGALYPHKVNIILVFHKFSSFLQLCL